MYRIVLAAGNSVDTPPEELETLAHRLGALEADYEVHLAPTRLQRGHAVGWWEVIHVWVPWEELSAAAAVRLVDAITDWVAHRIRARVENAGEKKNRWWVRPSMVIIYGPNGQPLIAVEQQEGDVEPRQIVKPNHPRQPPSLD